MALTSTKRIKLRPVDMHDAERRETARPVIYGEVLILRYPDGTQAIGGAPFDVAWHLQGFGAAPLFVSRIGDDSEGNMVLEAMHAWGLDTSGVQVDSEQRTSAAAVEVEHDFARIIMRQASQACDRIELGPALAATKSVSTAFIYHSAPCLRTEHSRQTLNDLLNATPLPVFFGVNFEEPWCQEVDWTSLLKRATWMGLTDATLPTIGAILDLSPGSPESVARRLQEACDLAVLFVTSGLEGAFAVTGSKEQRAVKPSDRVDVVDPVGTEAAFSAAVLYGLLRNWPLNVMLSRAQGFAHIVAAQPGPAIPAGAVYSAALEEWAAERIEDHKTVRASLPVPEEELLIAELANAEEVLDELKVRKESARLKADVASKTNAEDGGDETAKQAERSLEKLSEHVDDIKATIRTTKRALKKNSD